MYISKIQGKQIKEQRYTYRFSLNVVPYSSHVQNNIMTDSLIPTRKHFRCFHQFSFGMCGYRNFVTVVNLQQLSGGLFDDLSRRRARIVLLLFKNNYVDIYFLCTQGRINHLYVEDF